MVKLVMKGSDPLVVRTVELTTSDSTIGRQDIVTALAGARFIKENSGFGQATYFLPNHVFRY